MANFKSIYWCLTAGEWKRGFTLQGVQSLAIKRGNLVTHVIYQAIFDPETSDLELQQLEKCWCIAGLGEIMACDDRDSSDDALIEKRFRGWVAHEYRIAPKKTRAKKLR